MKKTSNLLCIIVVLITTHVSGYGNSTKAVGVEYLEKLVMTKKVMPLKMRLMQVHAQSGIPICLESLKSETPDAERCFAVGKGEAITIKDLKKKLEAVGYSCRTEQKYILISTPALKVLEGNPLDTYVDGFIFEGDHAALVKKLCDLGIDVATHIGRHKEKRYKFNLNGKISIRDILMEISSCYGIAWYVEISSKPPIYTIPQADGSMIEAKGISIFLTI